MIALERILTFLVLFSLVVKADGTERHPNVILILTDDQGSVDVNCYGAEDLATPHMDRIAERGVRFTQFYSAAPVCSPSRAGCLTGCIPQRAGVPGNVGQNNGLPPEQVTLAEMLRASGYATAHIGKWHLGHHPSMMPNAQGFDYSFGHMGGCIDNYSHFFYWNGPNRHDLWQNGMEIHRSGEFFGDMMVAEATEFIEANRDRPFFIYYAINMPHYPYQGDAKWLQHYRDLPYPRNLYAAFLSTVDERIGHLLTKLDELQLTDETIVILQSDHGHSEEERAHFGGGSSGPYRGHKFDLLEGGLRVPAMISWPGVLPEGETRDQFATGCDWFPTLATLCNAEIPRHRIDGKDIVPLIHSSDATSPHTSFYWESGGQKCCERELGNSTSTSQNRRFSTIFPLTWARQLT
ncbi:MAG: sulfatase-like hydrolase/transferase [Pirellulaceae bacterium]